MKVELMKITPSIALKMLEGNTNNRKIDLSHVSYLANEMRSGRWMENGDPIRFNGSSLLDGQHRLYAIVKADTSVRTVVVRDLGPEAFKTINVGGKGRTMGQVLSLSGETNTNVLSGAIRVVNDMRTDTNWKRSSQTLSPQYFFDFLRDEPGIRDSVVKMGRLKHLKKISGPSIPSGMHHLFMGIDEAKADEFMNDLDTGLVHDQYDPVYMLRQRLIDNASSRVKMERTMMLALYVKAWNARFVGTKIKNLKWAIGEQFPTLLTDMD